METTNGADKRQLRVVEAAADIRQQPGSADAGTDIIYQHSVLCQTCLPYRNPGDDVRHWERMNGRVALRLSAGAAYDSTDKSWVDVGLPYGPKPRMILAHLNSYAIINQTPEIEVEASLSAFTEKLGLARMGRNVRTIKDQLARLSAADFRFGLSRDGEGGAVTRTVRGEIVQSFDLWFPKDERQRVLWPTAVRLSDNYFNSLMEHAVPLDLRAFAALSESAMAMDIYAWLAQRLHRVPAGGSFLPWTALKEQFGPDIARMDNFKAKYRAQLKKALTVYPAARLQLDGRGMTMETSAPPVRKRMITTARREG